MVKRQNDTNVLNSYPRQNMFRVESRAKKKTELTAPFPMIWFFENLPKKSMDTYIYHCGRQGNVSETRFLTRKSQEKNIIMHT